METAVPESQTTGQVTNEVSKQPVTSKKQSVLLVIMALITILSLICAVYFGYQNYLLNQQLSEIKDISSPTASPSPTTDPTANWILFTNTSYKYSLKHPPTWTVSAKAHLDPTTDNEPVFDSSCDYGAGELCQQFFVDALESTNPSDFEPFFIIKDDDVVTEKQNIKIDGQDAVSFVHYYNYIPNYTDSGDLQYVAVTNFNGYKYTIFYCESQKGKEFKTSSDWNNKQLFDQILSTFKFTE